MKKRANILVVDDEQDMCELLDDALTKEGYKIQTALSGSNAIKFVKEEPFDIVILDLVMPEIGGMEVLKTIKEINPNTFVIMITAYGTIETAVEAMKIGAYDYITKPFRMSEIKIVIERALQQRRLAQENLRLQKELKRRYRFDNIVGTSAKMQEVYQMIEKVAASDCTVLIQGESGTGKELVARAIHYNSGRKDKPFIVQSCAVLPEELLESELFGHVKGSFTGAISTKHGLFKVADEGTFFLDEIGTVNLPVQSKLLRVLEEHEFKPLGGTETIKVDVRVIAATNKDLRKAVEEKTFREDLFYRLNVVTILVPPLRERKDDIPLLANHFLSKYNKASNKQINDISPEAMDLLMKYNWPGNVRELENVIERAVVLEIGKTIIPEALSQDLRIEKSKRDRIGESVNLSDTVKEAEREKIVEALEQTGWHKERAAKILGIHRKTLWQKMKAYNIKEKKEELND